MKKRRHHHEINTGMFADISFLLLIFFMVVTTFNRSYELPMKLPPLKENAQAAAIDKNRVLTIHINDLSQTLINDELHLKGESYSLTEQLRRICAHPKHGLISIKMHPDTPYAHYIGVLARLKEDKAALQQELAQELFAKSINQLNPEEQAMIIAKTTYSISEKEINYDETTSKN
jgi:biopolymer transport protein ExbD